VVIKLWSKKGQPTNKLRLEEIRKGGIAHNKVVPNVWLGGTMDAPTVIEARNGEDANSQHEALKNSENG
jgi:hypothetical protein